MIKLFGVVTAMCVALASPLAAEPGPPVAPTEVMVGDSLPYAYFATPEGDGPFPAIIILGGSEGGDFGSRGSAPHFLSEGYAILGLPYYSPAYLPKERQLPDLPVAFDSIPLEKLEIARDWLRKRKDVQADSIGLYGVSKGAEFVLAGASRIDGFAAVAAIVPSDVIWEGWGPNAKPGEVSSFSWQGRPLPFVPYLGMEEEFKKYAIPGATVRLRTPQDAGRRAHPDRVVDARIKVENIDEPVLVAGGDQDNTWNSGAMAQNIAERRAEAGNLETVALIFPDATHALSGTGVQRTEGDFRYDEPTLEAQQQIWPATLDFFAAHLKRP
ncbi:acyl-CoA thioester hydrolase/BAAT C-terminal domain-containing protein [Qipengyuania sp. NPDC077563]|uniref:acyl-CoA thioester hydrolase/BAAT C-terminal domain-containing protein n=1 Tax=Qipengyuania sp. NPDC077563 TaxID=3364497 RepID=UPI00384C7916